MSEHLQGKASVEFHLSFFFTHLETRNTCSAAKMVFAAGIWISLDHLDSFGPPETVSESQETAIRWHDIIADVPDTWHDRNYQSTGQCPAGLLPTVSLVTSRFLLQIPPQHSPFPGEPRFARKQ